MSNATTNIVNVRPLHTNGNAYSPMQIENSADARFVSALLAYASTHQLELAYEFTREVYPAYHADSEATK